MKHTDKIAIKLLAEEYSDYKANSWHYDREYKMLVKAQYLVLKSKSKYLKGGKTI